MNLLDSTSPHLYRLARDYIGPGADPDVLNVNPNRVPGLNLTYFTLHSLISHVGEPLVKEYAGRPYEEIKAEFHRRIKRFSRDFPESEVSIAAFLPGLAYYFIPSNDFEARYKSMKETLKAEKSWTARKDEPLGHCTLVHEGPTHPECPISWRVNGEDGRLKAIFGFLVYFKGGKKTARITNFQGKYGQKALLDELGRFVGEHWAVHLVKKFCKYAKRRGWAVEGGLPHWTTAEEAEYARQKGNYARTYSAAGFKRHADGIWRPA